MINFPSAAQTVQPASSSRPLLRRAVNGLPIAPSESNIAPYYCRNSIGGEAAFITVAKTILSFRIAAPEKSAPEIAQVGLQNRSG